MSKLNRAIGIVGGTPVIPFLIDPIALGELVYNNQTECPSADKVFEELCNSMDEEQGVSCKYNVNGCEYCFTGNCEEGCCEAEDFDEDVEDQDCMSILLKTVTLNTADEQLEFLKYVSSLMDKFKGADGFEVSLKIDPIKDPNGNCLILKGYEDVFLDLLKCCSSKSYLKNFLCADISVILKILN